jgi:hypothetical protein
MISQLQQASLPRGYVSVPKHKDLSFPPADAPKAPNFCIHSSVSITRFIMRTLLTTCMASCDLRIWLRRHCEDETGYALVLV